MNRMIVRACVAVIAAGLLAAPAQAGVRHFQGTVEGGGTVAFDVQFKHGKPKLAGNIDFGAVPVTCDEGNRSRHFFTKNMISVTHRRFQYEFRGFKASLHGKLNKKGKMATGDVSYGPNSPEPSSTNCSTGGPRNWHASR